MINKIDDLLKKAKEIEKDLDRFIGSEQIFDYSDISLDELDTTIAFPPPSSDRPPRPAYFVSSSQEDSQKNLIKSDDTIKQFIKVTPSIRREKILEEIRKNYEECIFRN